jgi:hypothetical protein
MSVSSDLLSNSGSTPINCSTAHTFQFGDGHLLMQVLQMVFVNLWPSSTNLAFGNLIINLLYECYKRFLNQIIQ